MTPHAAALSLVVIIVGLSAHGQVPRDPRAAATGTALLSGTVVSDEAEAKPVRRARVTCTAPELTDGMTAVTDDRGRFSCARLPAGRYSVNVTREGWVPVAYGARRPLRPGTPIALAAGQRAGIVVRMMRGAVITGTLLDETGQPAVNTDVVAMRSTLQNGERRVIALGVPGLTDDRGVYRIYGLPPGDYFVGATPHNRAGSELQATTDLDVHHARSARADTPPPPDRGVAFASTYFPGTPLLVQASAVTIGAGEERPGVDFALQLVATARVEGIVSTPDGGMMPPDAQLTLLASGQTAFPGVAFDGLRTTRIASEGTFSFAGIAPGVYTLLARATRPPAAPGEGGSADGGPQVLWASRDIAVDGERVSGVSLTLQPGLTLSGQVRFESATQKPLPDMRSIRAMLQPIQTSTATIAPAPVTPDASGRFQFSGVIPGRYRLIASFPGSGRPGGWLLKSATADGQDSLDAPFTVQPNQQVVDAAITFTDRLAQISGTLTDASGAAAPDYTAVLFPADPSRWFPQSRRLQGVRPSPDGAFTFHNLPAGDYVIAAVDDVEPGEWFDPAFLQRIAPAGTRLVVSEGEQKVQDLRVSAALETSERPLRPPPRIPQRERASRASQRSGPPSRRRRFGASTVALAEVEASGEAATEGACSYCLRCQAVGAPEPVATGCAV
jgi:Carboxypeptidase regulatory-like domain